MGKIKASNQSGRRMSMRDYERTAEDERADRSEAKREGKSVKAFEGSKKDREMDRAGLKRANRGRR